MSIDISPQLIEVEEGKIAYFYSLHQLEEIRHRKMNKASFEEIKGMLGNTMMRNVLMKFKKDK